MTCMPMRKQPNDKENQMTSREHKSVFNNTQNKELQPIVLRVFQVGSLVKHIRKKLALCFYVVLLHRCSRSVQKG